MIHTPELTLAAIPEFHRQQAATIVGEYYCALSGVVEGYIDPEAGDFGVDPFKVCADVCDVMSDMRKATNGHLAVVDQQFEDLVDPKVYKDLSGIVPISSMRALRMRRLIPADMQEAAAVVLDKRVLKAAQTARTLPQAVAHIDTYATRDGKNMLRGALDGTVLDQALTARSLSRGSSLLSFVSSFAMFAAEAAYDRRVIELAPSHPRVSKIVTEINNHASSQEAAAAISSQLETAIVQRVIDLPTISLVECEISRGDYSDTVKEEMNRRLIDRVESDVMKSSSILEALGLVDDYIEDTEAKDRLLAQLATKWTDRASGISIGISGQLKTAEAELEHLQGRNWISRRLNKSKINRLESTTKRLRAQQAKYSEAFVRLRWFQQINTNSSEDVPVAA